MTVIELIAALDRMPLDVTVKYYGEYEDWNVSYIEDVLDHNGTRIVRIS